MNMRVKPYSLFRSTGRRCSCGNTLGKNRGASHSDPTDEERCRARQHLGRAVDHTGSVRFTRAPAGRGTEIHVALTYRPPGGMMGGAVAKPFGRAPDQQIQEELRRIKQTMETGETPTTCGQSKGTSDE